MQKPAARSHAAPTLLIPLLNFLDDSLRELDRADIDRHHKHFQDLSLIHI